MIFKSKVKEEIFTSRIIMGNKQDYESTDYKIAYCIKLTNH